MHGGNINHSPFGVFGNMLKCASFVIHSYPHFMLSPFSLITITYGTRTIGVFTNCFIFWWISVRAAVLIFDDCWLDVGSGGSWWLIGLMFGLFMLANIGFYFF